MSEIIHIDATPQKRLFLSIIADYDINTAVCDLIDNAIDHWIDGRRDGNRRLQTRSFSLSVVSFFGTDGCLSQERIWLIWFL